ncbi:hypothetical protein GCM10020216_034000 [Nonomuraea helvata]
MFGDLTGAAGEPVGSARRSDGTAARREHEEQGLVLEGEPQRADVTAWPEITERLRPR